MRTHCYTIFTLMFVNVYKATAFNYNIFQLLSLNDVDMSTFSYLLDLDKYISHSSTLSDGTNLRGSRIMTEEDSVIETAINKHHEQMINSEEHQNEEQSSQHFLHQHKLHHNLHMNGHIHQHAHVNQKRQHHPLPSNPLDVDNISPTRTSSPSPSTNSIETTGQISSSFKKILDFFIPIEIEPSLNAA